MPRSRHRYRPQSLAKPCCSADEFQQPVNPVSGIARIGYDLANLREHLNRWRVVQRFILLLAGHVFLALTGVQLMRGAIQSSTTTTLLLAGVLVLLLSGCRSAWLLALHGNA